MPEHRVGLPKPRSFEYELERVEDDRLRSIREYGCCADIDYTDIPTKELEKALLRKGYTKKFLRSLVRTLSKS